MRRIILCALAIFLVWGAVPTISSGEEEVCVACDKKVVVSGQFEHKRASGSTRIEGASWRGGDAFREEIYGTNFTVAVSGLPAGKYNIQIGLVEVDYTNAGARVFDIRYGKEMLASNLDIFAAAGGTGKVYFVRKQIDYPGETAGGPMTFTFTGVTNMAKLNTFEIHDASGQSIVYTRAMDLIGMEDADAFKAPVITGSALWKNPALPLEVRVKDLVRRMSLAEKVQQMRNNAPAIPRLGLPAYNYWNECLHGVARAGVATVFPQAIGMAATWDLGLIHQEADVIATEARAKHNDYIAKHNGDSAQYYGLTFWTPNINIFRDPRWGRGQETYGEDPFLTSRMAVSFIRGLQGNDPKYIKAMACAKHFAVHSGPEPERHRFDAEPSQRDFYETYLPQFEAAVREGKVGGVMGAYNSLFGKPACASPLLLTDLLRKQWGFDGYVTSDCGAIYDIFANHHYVKTPEEAAAAAVKAGCDICCGVDYNSLVLAVKKGLVTEQEIDTALSHVLATRFRLGLFDPPGMVPYSKISIDQNNTLAHRALALRVACESMVLLKNDRVLPLDRSKIKRIAVIGANANSERVLLGNYNGTPSNPVTILDGIKAVAGTNIEVTYAEGCPLAVRDGGSNKPSQEMLTNALNAAWSADVVIYVGGISPRLEGEEMRVRYVGFSGGDRTQIELPSVQTDFLKALQATGKPVVFVNCSGSAIAMPWEATNLPAILQAWYPGEEGGRAVAEVLFGDVNPAGRLPITFYRSTSDLPPLDDYSMSNRTYRYFNGKPLFAFGHGLSYTHFEYSNAQLDHAEDTASDTVRLSVNVSNTGNRDGDEVVQVYFRHVNPPQPQPNEALCSFARIHLPHGKTARLTLNIPVNRFRFWDPDKEQYTVESGDYELLVGSASDDIRQRLLLHIGG